MTSAMQLPEGLPAIFTEMPNAAHYIAPLMENPPTMDGFIRPIEWPNAIGFDGYLSGGELELRRVKAFIGATRTHLYFAVMSELPEDITLISPDDTVEFWLDPEPQNEKGIAFQTIIHVDGKHTDMPHIRGGFNPEAMAAWNGNYQITYGKHDGYWHCVARVPIADISSGRQITDGAWGLNICRVFKNPDVCASVDGKCNAQGITFQFVEQGALGIRLHHRTDPFTREINTTLSLHNPDSQPISCHAHLFLQRDLMPEVQQQVELLIPAGETKLLNLRVGDETSNKFTLYATVIDACGAYLYSTRQRWGRPRDNRWDVQSALKPPFDFCFAYFPYQNRLRLLADTSNLPKTTKLSAVDFIVRKKYTSDVISDTHLNATAFTGGSTEIFIDLQELNGEYEILAQLSGENLPVEPIIKSFERNVYDWEHNALGMSRTVYPPFTPITVQGYTLGTALKEYVLNDFGLLEHIRTTDIQEIATRELLAAPMRYVASLDGKTVTATPLSQHFIEQAADRVIAESKFSLGALSATAHSLLDYDGMLRIDLTLEPTTVPVETLDLEIPLCNETTTLMHTMVEGLRYPIFTDRVPEGVGVFWSAAKLAVSDFPQNFCTYIFLGDAVRGLCWFAENDRGWSWESTAGPNLELERRGDTLLLRVHLFNTPCTIDEPRTLTFGLQAAPVKPRLEGWRHRWYTDRYTILGCDRHWYALGDYGSRYPAGKDMFLWEEIKRSNTEHFTDAEIECFIEHGWKYFEPHPGQALEEFLQFPRWNLRNRFNTQRIFYYNRSSTGCDPEFHTFLDEWGLEDWNDRDRAYYGANEVKANPVKSFIDFSLYWYGKSFDIGGNIGVYSDNNFFISTFNTVMSGAYKKADGSIMPCTGLWELRELAKRTFVYMNELGMKPIHMVHMFTVQVLPMNSFYTVQYDWEWHFNEGVVHTRYSREYLQLVSNGDHCGLWPIVLHDYNHDPWIYKTYLGVGIIHEIMVDRFIWHGQPTWDGDTPENHLFAIFREPINSITQQTDVEVYRYWDQRVQPMVSENTNLPGIVFVRKGVETLFYITSYAQQDEQAIIHIDAIALGFTGEYYVTDLESREKLAVENNVLQFTIKMNDLRGFRLTGTATN